MASFAALGERAAVGILMTTGARCERESGVLGDFGVGRGRPMAFGAFHRLVFSDEGEMRGGMVERLHGFPCGHAVTLFTVGSQLSRMLILMAGETGGMQTFECVAQVVHPDLLPVGGRDMFGVVALLAMERGVAAD